MTQSNSCFPATKLLDFEFRVFRRLKLLASQNAQSDLALDVLSETKSQAKSEPTRENSRRILIACSGGLDSVVLAHCLKRISERMGLDLALAYVHHGPAVAQEISAYRSQAQKHVEELAAELKIPIHISPAEAVKETLNSEEALRIHRHEALEKICQANGYDSVALAHHADDLFETRLIRLIRGTGPQGLMAMTERDRSAEGTQILRPLLTEPKSELLQYAQSKKLIWIDDPSNADKDPLRNWLRNEWLPSLNEKRAGAPEAFRRSLEQIAAAISTAAPAQCALEISCPSENAQGFDRKAYMRLGITERRQVIASFLLCLGAKSFTSSHIEEIRKRVETSKKLLTFELLKFKWEVNAEQIRAFPLVMPRTKIDAQ